MVATGRKMPQCEIGNHKMCRGGVPTRPGETGGTICSCECHQQKALKKQEGKDIYFPSQKPHST